MQCRGVVSTGIRRFENTIPLIFVITATYKRFTQKAELVRFSHVLKQVPNILWIVVEDSESKTAAIADFLSSSGVSHVYLSIGGTKRHNVKPKGVLPRNRALQYARESLKIKPRTSVIYIADDDNTYTLRLFEEVNIIIQRNYHLNHSSISTWYGLSKKEEMNTIFGTTLASHKRCCVSNQRQLDICATVCSN